MRIVVFGAGGCVGGWICEELSLRDDIEQIACVHKWASAVRLARRGVDIRQADLENAKELPAILNAADVVVNAAMLLPSREPELVTALYLASVKAGVRRFIQFSSAAVYGNRTGDVDEKWRVVWLGRQLDRTHKSSYSVRASSTAPFPRAGLSGTWSASPKVGGGRSGGPVTAPAISCMRRI